MNSGSFELSKHSTRKPVQAMSAMSNSEPRAHFSTEMSPMPACCPRENGLHNQVQEAMNRANHRYQCHVEAYLRYILGLWDRNIWVLIEASGSPSSLSEGLAALVFRLLNAGAASPEVHSNEDGI